MLANGNQCALDVAVDSVEEIGGKDDTTLPLCTNTPLRALQHAILSAPQQKLPAAHVKRAAVLSAQSAPSSSKSTSSMYQHIGRFRLQRSLTLASHTDLEARRVIPRRIGASIAVEAGVVVRHAKAIRVTGARIRGVC